MLIFGCFYGLFWGVYRVVFIELFEDYVFWFCYNVGNMYNLLIVDINIGKMIFLVF